MAHTAGSLEFVDFYADRKEFSALIHCEPLAQRSKLHDWSIQPHRHNNIDQVFLLTSGAGTAYFDAKRVALCAPCMLVIPGNLMHGFEWRPGCEGFVVSVASVMLKQIGAVPANWGNNEQAVLYQLSEVQVLEQLCHSLYVEQSERPVLSDAMQKSLLEQLVINIVRLSPAQSADSRALSKPERKLAQFKALIQSHATQHHQVDWYARQIGVSSTHLNQICRQLENTNALSMIHRQILVEGKRYLIFADLTVASVADRLGFSEPGYFNKFFKRQTGESPAAFRRQARG